MTVPILMYHQIHIPPAHKMPFRSMIVHPDRFRSQMRWLKRLGYKGLSLRDAVPYIEGRAHGKVAVITFDDGFRNVYENALPVLQEHGFTATNFFVANQIGGQNEWDIPIGIQPTPCMSPTQLREWAALGHEVGAHTLDHVHLPDVPLKEAKRQIGGSRDVLQDILGAPVTSFAYPYGDENARLRDMAREVGFTHAVTTERRKTLPSDDSFGLPRLTIRRNDTWLHFLKKCLI
ncbi:polysaccharide deacetylase family protein [Phyllobacterium leguminum]|uniref:Chitooligosaccharide deacetylase n=1 Tax=Phyllobacterium leguminum TaxID=314237 RepID=A0A318TB89_9HYPH|nr:polysaccharide deacetylase family protein [Phyllobacterium leguminum]PYE88200.1 peptidoglycan/xylan/chitin deacetylase (PgdA/CDA1 family) [Phyllobacterium leguminum]